LRPKVSRAPAQHTGEAAAVAMEQAITTLFEPRYRAHARERLRIETAHELRLAGHAVNFFDVESWYSIHSLIRTTLRLAGLYRRGCRNAERVAVRHNFVSSTRLPSAFEGFTILHVSDLHVELSQGANRRLIELVGDLRYDLCVLTGDYRSKTFGPFAAALEGLETLRAHLNGPVYAVLGNHDTIRMVPVLEGMGIGVLLNESTTLVRGDQCIHLAGIDDAHFYRVDNIAAAAGRIPPDDFSILLSHTPEIYRQAAQAGFDVLLSGHTHGGQICLPGSIPITLDSVLPRHMGSGSWTYGKMAGYTSVGVGACIVAVRLNCPAEITLHHFSAGAGQGRCLPLSGQSAT
jgi:uncharacterized protein